jgi:pimeloyl-ACP methyl ester carboxylesterase
MEKIELKTEDGLKLAGLVSDQQGSVSVILLHMMPATKESWSEFAGQLAESGCNVVAFDFRGHGESEGGSYEDFSPEDHQKYSLDLDSAVGYVKEKFPETEIYLVGASIGANIAIKYLTQHHEIKKAVALSAGLNYHGINAEELVKETDPSQDLLLIAAADDMRKNGISSNQQAEMLYGLANCKIEKLVFQTGGHGTALLTTHTDLYKSIEDFFVN